MAAGTRVQLRLGERVVAEVSFRGDELRIGRMKENDLVINNLAVSRFHAVLRRRGDGFEVEDLGSENGTFVNGAQVKGTAPVPEGGELTIGKHALSIRTGDEDDLPSPRARSKSDAWDAGQTYFAPELAARALAGAAEPAEAEDEEQIVVAETADDTGLGALAHIEPTESTRRAAALERPDPEGRYAFGEEELVKPAAPARGAAPSFSSEFDVPAPEPVAAGAPARPETGSTTALFDFGATDDLGLSEPSLARVAAAKAAEAAAPVPPRPSAGGAHAGLIVERSGKVERVAPFPGTELVVGRGPSCELVLPTAGVSRRHARFVREGETFRVLDLGSANGIRVNGERATERVLQVGDVVAIDDYTLTFVLDREPLDEAVRSAPAPRAEAGKPHVTVLQDAPLASIVEQDLVTAGEEDAAPLDGEKELEIVAELGTAEHVAYAEDGSWVFEVTLSPESLPPVLQAALRELRVEELRLPAELRLRRR